MAIDDADDRVAGFVNMLSDGVLTAFIPWLEVLPGYQRQGIGGELMCRILDGTDRFYSVDLVCDAPLVSYYERFGMHGASSALLRHPAALAGFGNGPSLLGLRSGEDEYPLPPLSTYSSPRGLRQDPGRAVKSPAVTRTCGNESSEMRVLLSAARSRGDAGLLPCRRFPLGNSPAAKDCAGGGQ